MTGEMTATEFRAASLLLQGLKKRRQPPLQAAEQVLVYGLAMTEAADQIGVSRQSVHQVCESVRDGLELARRVSALVLRNPGDSPIAKYKIGSYLWRSNTGYPSRSVLAVADMRMEGINGEQAAKRYGLSSGAVWNTSQRIDQLHSVAVEVAKLLLGDSFP